MPFVQVYVVIQTASQYVFNGEATAKVAYFYCRPITTFNLGVILVILQMPG